MKRKIWLLLMLGACLGVSAQDMRKTMFCSPFDFPLSLSANFGELRPNHFHNGIDIKTQGGVGKPIRCIADGYVSRILVMHGGYGQAIFVTHPNGLTSVYGHVVSFAPTVQKYVRSYQYAHETYVCDIRPKSGELSFKQGDVIALSGNEGSSAGPHLHLELRRTDTGDYIDPLPYFKHLLKDTRSPIPSLVAFYPLEGKGVIDGGTTKKLVPLARLSQPVTAWGKIYTGISAYDYMNGTSNIYGVHSVKLYVDSTLVFSSQTDSVSPGENRMVNAFTDYDELMRTRRLIMCSYILPACHLRMLHAVADRGAVTIDQERNYRFTYVLEDGFGNRRTCSFTVRGRKQPIPPAEPTRDKMLYWNRTNIIHEPGMELIVPKECVYDHASLHTEVEGDSTGISLTYHLDIGRTPLQDYCTLAIGLRQKLAIDSSKYYIVQQAGRWSTPIGGKYANGWIKARVRNLGTFRVAIDTVPPRIAPLARNRWRTLRDIRFTIGDSGSGIATYKVFVDGKFVLFRLVGRTLSIVDRDRIRKGVPHTIEVRVTDNCGNEAREEFKY